MCGIVGYYNLDGAPVDARVLARMISIQLHRGPDDQGARLFSLRRAASFEISPGSEAAQGQFEGGLGFARLSILDLSEQGHQPMVSDDGGIALAFNGEIYNAFSFKSQLQDAGFKFRGSSDTEVVLRLYEYFGLEGMLERINGMFAIVIVDMRQRTLTLIRDETGIKPLLWSRIGNTILFGSEIKSFLAHPNFQCRLSEADIDEYLAFRYCASDRHLIGNVHPLRPGHLMRISLDQAPVVRRYYNIPDSPSVPLHSSNMILDELETKLRASVQSQLLADVKVGCQLSGGVDSSLVTLFANAEKAKSVDAFSVVFRDQRYSEDRWVSEAAQVAGADSHRFMFEANDFFDALEPSTWHLEQPINHPNTLGLFCLAKNSRPLVKVLLSGEGADELMGGYNRFYYAATRPYLWQFGPLLRRLPVWGEKWQRNFGLDTIDETDFFILASAHLRPEQLLQLRPGIDVGQLLESRRSVFDEGQGDYLSKCMKYEMQTHMVDLLLRQDRMTMAHSLEGRVPFLDRDLISFVRSLPSKMLVGNELRLTDRRMHNTKKLLKSLARRFFSEAFVHRPKSGFTLPLLDYYQDSRFVSLMEDRILPGIKQRGLFDPDPVRLWFKNVRAMPRTLDESYWTAIMFELWAQQWLDGGGRAQVTQPRAAEKIVVATP